MLTYQIGIFCTLPYVIQYFSSSKTFSLNFQLNIIFSLGLLKLIDLDIFINFPTKGNVLQSFFSAPYITKKITFLISTQESLKKNSFKKKFVRYVTKKKKKTFCKWIYCAKISKLNFYPPYHGSEKTDPPLYGEKCKSSERVI